MRDGLLQLGVDERMTAGTSGGTPENDDPFGYLYRREGGTVADEDVTARQPQYGQPGVPRTSYHQVTRVGQREPRQAVPPQPQPVPGHQAEPAPAAPGGRAAARRRTSPGELARNPLVAGALALVAAVVLGVGIALSMGGDDSPAGDRSAKSGTAAVDKPGSRDTEPDAKPSAEPAADALPPVTDAASLVLGGGAKKSTEFAGAFAKDGTYIDGMQSPGATVTWKPKMPEAGQYRFNIRYGNAGEDVDATLLVNGKPQSINLGNFTKQKDPAKAWTRSFGIVTLQKGENVLDLTCGGGAACAFSVDQVAITRGDYPPDWP